GPSARRARDDVRGAWASVELAGRDRATRSPGAGPGPSPPVGEAPPEEPGEPRVLVLEESGQAGAVLFRQRRDLRLGHGLAAVGPDEGRDARRLHGGDPGLAQPPADEPRGSAHEALQL